MNIENLNNYLPCFHLDILAENEDIEVGVMSPELSFQGDLESLKALYRQNLVIPDQTHSINVEVMVNDNVSYPDTDALISFQPRRPIGIITADCVPIIIYATDIKWIAAIHAGWRGTLNGIADVTVEKLKQFGADPERMMVWFGPSVCKDCYEVSEELGRQFIEEGYKDFVYYIQADCLKPNIDLQGINIRRFVNKGVELNNIFPNTHCTRTCRDAYGQYMYPSYRRDGSESLRLITFVNLRK